MSITKKDLDNLESNIDNKLVNIESRIDDKLDNLENRMDEKLTGLENRIDRKLTGLENRMDKKMDKLEQKMDTIFYKYKSELVDLIDPILKEVKNSREDHTVMSHQISRNSERLVTVESKLQISSN